MKQFWMGLVVMGALAAAPAFAEEPESFVAVTEANVHWDLFARCDVRDPWEFINSYDHKAEADLALSYLKSFGCEGFIKEVRKP